MSEALGVRGVVVGHGDMPQGLVDALRHIAGNPAADVVAISNHGMSPRELAAAVREAAGAGPAIVFADLRTGSCGIAGAFTCRDSDRHALICGVNLPMLLDFVFHRELPLHDLVDRLVEKGREAIGAVPAPGT